MNPQPEWDDLKSYYSTSYEAYDVNHGSYTDNDEKNVELAKLNGEFRHLSLPIEKKRILDVGCGGGYFLRIAKQLGAIVAGVEPSEAGANLSKSQGLQVFHGMLNEFVKDDANANIFDIITSNHVLEHTPDPIETLKDMKKLLAPNGFIWISVPNVQCYFSQKLGKHWHSSDLPYHIQQFSPESLALAGKQAGLSVRRQYTYSLPAGTLASLRYYLRKNYFIPQRLTQMLGLVEIYITSKLAKYLDQKGLGEAIIIEFEEISTSE